VRVGNKKLRLTDYYRSCDETRRMSGERDHALYVNQGNKGDQGYYELTTWENGLKCRLTNY